MRWIRIAAFPLFLGLVAPTAATAAPGAEATTVEELVQVLEREYKDVQSLRADVVQVTRSPASGEIRLKGKVHLERPRKARWELNGGGQDSLFITDGETIWVYTPAANQVMKSKDMSQSGSTVDPLDILNNLDERFDVKMLDEGGGRTYVIEGVPKEGTDLAGRFKRIRIEVDRKKYLPERIVMVGHFGDETELTFSSVKFNVDIDDSLFTFTPPPGVTVVTDTP